MGHNPHITYRPDIDGLRGVTVLFVLLFHAFPNWVPGGFIGVDVFFVISGFLISSIIFKSCARGDFSLREFYGRRVRRIFPALIVVLAATAILGWIYLLPDDYEQLGKYIAAGAGFVQNFVLCKYSGYFDSAATLKPLLHLWSLAIEEQFYLIYPLLVLALWKKRGTFLGAILLIASISFVLNIVRVGKHPVEALFMFYTRFWELLAGGALAFLPYYKHAAKPLTRRSGDILSVLGCLLIVFAVALLNKNKSFPGWWALMPVSGSVLLLMAGNAAWINRVVLSCPTMNFIGRISYPLYLWHWPLLSFARIQNPDVTAWTRAEILALSALLAWITYQFVEKPIRFGEKTVRAVRIVASCMTAACICGLLIYQAQGVPSRLPKPLQEIASYRYDSKSTPRFRQCFLNDEKTHEDFPKTCWGGLADGNDDGTVVLWGDSHMAFLSPGVRAVWGDEASIAQFTMSACPPLLEKLEGGTAKCEKSNQFVASILMEHPRATVVLFAAWTIYSKNWTADSPAGKSLLHTVRYLHDAGVTKIIVMGPAPNWKQNLPKLLLLQMQDSGNLTVPSRMNSGLSPFPEIADGEIRSLLYGSPAAYFSVTDTLCNSDGCLVRTAEQQTSFTTFDYGHLTAEAARIVAGRLPLDSLSGVSLLKKP